MALIDSDASEIVIRVVYDGPPEAGKTTSLRALAGSLAQPSYTPAEDTSGRTLWFDWMEYIGGRFEGCQIRCQIVSVPGQRALTARRRRVIDGGDVVVFVADSAVSQTAETLAYLRELRTMLAGVRDAPVGVVLQANKRDLAGAIPIDELRGALAQLGWPIGVVESVAADGTGIREAFVYAVRLALDRVRELMGRGALREAPSGRSAASELLDALRADDRARFAAPPPMIEAGPTSPAAELLREVLAYEHAARAPIVAPRAPSIGAARPPDTTVPSGAIWPPVEGRAILCELAQVALVPRRLSNGDWAAGLGSGWRVVSSSDAAFAAFDHGRGALVQWARLHASTVGAISPHRCIVLADDGHGAWRLWQIVRAEDSVRELVARALRDHTGDALVTRIGHAAQYLIDAQDRLARISFALPCTVDAIGPSETGAVYIGLMPDPTRPAPEHGSRIDPRALLRSQLDAALAVDLRERGLSVDDVLDKLAARLSHSDGIEQAVTTMLGA
jgi:signal recognition particle receptor subunit beta